MPPNHGFLGKPLYSGLALHLPLSTSLLQAQEDILILFNAPTQECESKIGPNGLGG